MKECLDALYSLVSEFVYDSQGDINYYGSDDQHRLSMPSFLIKLFEEACYSNMMIVPTLQSTSKDFYFMGVKVIESYNLEIAYFHIDYPMYKDKVMLKKIPLEPMYVEKGNRFEKRILQIQSAIPKNSAQNNQSN